MLFQRLFGVRVEGILLPIEEGGVNTVSPFPPVNIRILDFYSGLSVEDHEETVGGLPNIINVLILIVLSVGHHLRQVPIVTITQFIVFFEKIETLE